MPDLPDLAPQIRLIPIGTRAPTAVESEWRDPDDTNPNRRKARTVKGTRAADPVRAIASRGKGVIERRHVRAADRYLADYEVGVLGARPVVAERVGGRGNGVLYPSEEQCARLRSVMLADKALGHGGARVVRFVVCGVPDPTRRDVAAYARWAGVDPKVAMGLLAASLERLAEHYGLSADEKDS